MPLTQHEIEKLFENAPEGATHYSAVNDMFYIFHGSASGKYWSNSREDWMCAGTIGDYSHMIPRPSSPAWNGEGLPPVGTVCEYVGGKHGMPEPCPVEIIHHYHGGATMVAAFLYTRDGQTRVAGAIADCFRQIRTPEQIATAEREAVIDSIMDDLSLSPECRYIAKRVFDAGYRKVEAKP